jgi:hypothetical protein
MSDSLRDRIAAVIARHRMDRSNYEMADAVIAELALEQEWGCPTNNCRCSHRYVTEWKINDE